MTFHPSDTHISDSRPLIVISLMILLGSMGGATALHAQAEAFRYPAECERSALGYCIQCKQDGPDPCRLLSEQGTVLGKGSLREMQKRLGQELKNRYGDGYSNLPFWTMGGKQFWADQYVLAGWRIQKNVFTGHHRLLDGDGVRQAWGSYEECRAVFASFRARRSISPRSSHWIILIHGLLRSARAMDPLMDELKRPGYEVISINYPSSYSGISAHAQQLATVLNRVRHEVDSISFVTHSMGGIVLRKLLSLDQPWKKKMKMGRVVMVAPPSKGSDLARLLDEWYPDSWIGAEGLEDLTPEEVNKLPYPETEFGIIAGIGPDKEGWNPLLDGNDDGTLKLKNVKTKQATDIMTVQQQHSLLMYDDRVPSAVCHFLQNGSFPDNKQN